MECEYWTQFAENINTSLEAITLIIYDPLEGADIGHFYAVFFTVANDQAIILDHSIGIELSVEPDTFWELVDGTDCIIYELLEDPEGIIFDDEVYDVRGGTDYSDEPMCFDIASIFVFARVCVCFWDLCSQATTHRHMINNESQALAQEAQEATQCSGSTLVADSGRIISDIWKRFVEGEEIDARVNYRLRC